MKKVNTTSKETIIESISSLGHELITNYAINVNGNLCAFTDLEVYFWHPKHPDDFAKGVDHNRPFGELEAHRYGIDISLGNEEDKEFGGILICGLFDIQKSEPIQKPAVVKIIVNHLLIGSNQISLEKHKNSWGEVFKSARMNLGKADTTNKKQYVDAKYKFLAKDKKVFKGYKGKEAIFKASDLDNEEIKEILGYDLKR